MTNTSRKSNHNPLGRSLGLGLRSEYFDHLKDGHPAFQWLEMITENFLDATSQTLEDLIGLRSHYHLAFHGVSLSIGGQHPIDLNYLAKVKKLADRLKPTTISDHLSFSRYHNQNSHDLLPIAYTEDSLLYLTERIQLIQDYLGQRLYLENPSAYLSYQISVIPEHEFIAHLCKHTGCGMILDVNNLYVNQCNLGLNPIPYLDGLDSEWIGYIHMAGHLDQPGVKIDTHGTTICSEVWDLYRVALQKLGAVPSMIERDQNIPDFKEILDESLHMGTLLHQAHLQTEFPTLTEIPTTSQTLVSESPAPPPSRLSLQRNGEETAQPMPWLECTRDFFAALTRKSDQGWATFGSYLRADLPTQPTVGYAVYKQGYPIRLLDTLKGQMPAFSQVLGEKNLDHLLWAFLNQHPPSSYCVDRSLFGFSSFLGNPDHRCLVSQYFADSPLGVEAFAELALWEQCIYQVKALDSLPQRLTTAEFLESLEDKTVDELFAARVKAQPSTRILGFDYDILTSWISYQKKRPIPLPKQKPTYAIACKVHGQFKTQRLPRWQYRFLTSVLQGHSIGESLMESGIPQKSMVQKGLIALGYWTEKGLFASIHWPTHKAALANTERHVDLPLPDSSQVSHQVSRSP